LKARADGAASIVDGKEKGTFYFSVKCPLDRGDKI
jgi:hypothetical protein